MLTPFQVHASLVAQAQQFLGGGAAGQRGGGALLTLFGAQFPCTHGEIIGGFSMGEGGKSDTTLIEQCEFLASDVPAGKVPRKGQFCTLTLPAGQVFQLQLWSGGLQPGGLTWRFMLVSQSYNAG